MAIQDPVADMLTRIRNGQMAKHKEVVMPSSKQKVAIAQVLKKEGYIADFTVTEHGFRSEIAVELKYYQGKAVIEKIKRESCPSVRNYCSVKQFPKVKGGLGISIISTSKGVMADREAREQGVGGELLCTVQ